MPSFGRCNEIRMSTFPRSPSSMVDKSGEDYLASVKKRKVNSVDHGSWTEFLHANRGTGEVSGIQRARYRDNAGKL